MQRCFFGFYPSTKKETQNKKWGDWMRCVCLIATVLHFVLIVFCLAFCGFGPMIFNFFQCMFVYSVYLTLREREMIGYLLLLVGQIVYCTTKLMGGDDEKAAAATQTGGYIGNIVACGILLYMAGRAEWMFHQTGGLHGDGLTKAEQLEQFLIVKEEEEAENDVGDKSKSKSTAKEIDPPTDDEADVDQTKKKETMATKKNKAK